MNTKYVAVLRAAAELSAVEREVQLTTGLDRRMHRIYRIMSRQSHKMQRIYELMARS